MADTILSDITGKKKKYDPFEGNADLSAADPTAVVPVAPTPAKKKTSLGGNVFAGSSQSAIGGTTGYGALGASAAFKNAKAKATPATVDASIALEDTNVNIRKELGLDTILSNKKRARDKTTKTTALGA